VERRFSTAGNEDSNEFDTALKFLAGRKMEIPVLRCWGQGMSQYISEHWNGDRRLIQLTNMLSSAAQAAARGEATSDKKQEIIKFLNRGGWKEKDVQRMLTMACSLLETGASPKVYEHGKHLVEDLYTSPRGSRFWSLLRCRT